MVLVYTFQEASPGVYEARFKFDGGDFTSVFGFDSASKKWCNANPDVVEP